MRRSLILSLVILVSFTETGSGQVCPTNTCNIVTRTVTPVVQKQVVTQQVLTPVNTQVVATMPLATNLQAYQYQVNYDAFNNYRNYMQNTYSQQNNTSENTKSTASNIQLDGPTVNRIAQEVLALMRKEGIVTSDNTAEETSPLVDYGSAEPTVPNTGNYFGDGLEVLEKNCKLCHQLGNNPKAEYVMFDATGELSPSLDFTKIGSRVRSKDPDYRMPPSKSLSDKEVMEILHFGLSQTGKANPFE